MLKPIVADKHAINSRFPNCTYSPSSIKPATKNATGSTQVVIWKAHVPAPIYPLCTNDSNVTPTNDNQLRNVAVINNACQFADSSKTCASDFANRAIVSSLIA